MKLFWHLIGLLSMILLFLTGCAHQSKTQQATDKTLQTITSEKSVWYLYRGSGTHSVISLQFLNDKTVIVKDIDEIGAPGGENRVNSNFANPKYVLKQSAKLITIKTSNRDMLLKIGNKYSETVDHKKISGYRAVFDSQSNWKLGLVKSDSSDGNGTAIQSSNTQKKTPKKAQPKNLTTRLMNFVVNPTSKASPLKNVADAGNYIYRTMVGQNRAYGQITLNPDGTYQNSLSVHAVQTKNQTDDNPDVAYYEVQTGYVEPLYGKYYFVPQNLLRVTYYVHGQNPDKPLPQQIALYTGDNISLSRARIEHVGNSYQFYSKDYEPWSTDSQNGNSDAIPLTKTNQTQINLQAVYQAALNQYNNLKNSPISSNQDLMQVVAAISDNNANKIGDVGLNFAGSYGITQQPSDYQGIAKDGSKQALMNYVFAVSPASTQSGTAVIATQSGDLLVYGALNNQLYQLHQPDSDSATVTWMPVQDVSLQVPQLRVLLNP